MPGPCLRPLRPLRALRALCVFQRAFCAIEAEDLVALREALDAILLLAQLLLPPPRGDRDHRRENHDSKHSLRLKRYEIYMKSMRKNGEDAENSRPRMAKR